MEAVAAKAKRAGNKCLHNGDYTMAHAHYTRGIECDDAIQLYSNRAAANVNLQDLVKSEEDARRAAALAPDWGKPHLRLAEVYHGKCEYVKAVDELEIALGLGAAARDNELVASVYEKMDEYRLLKDAEMRGESQNLAYSAVYRTEGAYREAAQASAGLREDQDPNELLDKVLKMKIDDTPALDRHVLLGHQAIRDGRYHDAAREYLAAAVIENAEGMYNYAVVLEAGRGVKKTIGEAVQWLERASRVAVKDEDPPNRNCGIGEAMSSLARHNHLGIHFAKDEAKAAELWHRAASLGSVASLNSLGVLHMNGRSGSVRLDLAAARDYFRQAAEKLSNEAMVNLAELHGSLQEFEVAARWADTAVRFGFPLRPMQRRSSVSLRRCVQRWLPWTR